MNNIGYIPDWSFYLIDKDKNKPPPYSFSVDIAYDFYCCLFYNNKIIQFVIKISDDKTIDSTDIYAMQFNMHILKINKKVISVKTSIDLLKRFQRATNILFQIMTHLKMNLMSIAIFLSKIIHVIVSIM